MGRRKVSGRKLTPSQRKQIKLWIWIAFACASLGLGLWLVGALSGLPDLAMGSLIAVTVLAPISIVIVLDLRFPKGSLPDADVGTLVTVAGLMFTVVGFTYIPFLNWVVVAFDTQSLLQPLPKPDTSFFNIAFTVIGVGLALWGLWHALEKPQSALAECRSEKRKLQDELNDIRKELKTAKAALSE